MIRALALLLLTASVAGAWTTRGFDDTKAPYYLELPAAGCQGTTASSAWDLPTTTPAVAACVGSTTFQGVLDFADTSGGFAAFYTLTLPADWTTNRLPDVALYWQTSVTSGNVKFTVQFVCTAVNAAATDDPAYPTAGNAGHNILTVAVPGTTNRVQTSALSGATLPTSCVTNTKTILHMRLFRDGADAADTATGATVRFKGMELIMYGQE